MATFERAQQIANLSETLAPLDDKSRGMPVEADEWNTIIGILRDLLQINRNQDEDVGGQIAQNFASAEHEHLGQVTLAWLDAELQTRFTDGGDGVATRQALASMRRLLNGLQIQVAQLTALSENQRTALDRVKIGELDRDRLLRGFDTRFGGLEDLQSSVTAVARSHGALREGVDEVLSLRERLTDDNGDAIDVTQIATRLNELEGVREALTDIDGAPLRLRDLQLDLIQLRETLPQDAGGNLDSRLSELEAGLQRRFDEREGSNMAALREEIASGLEGNRVGFDERFEQGLAVERASTLEAVRELNATSEARSSSLIDQRFGDQRTELRDFARETAAAEAGSLLNGVDGRIDRRVERELEGVTDELRGELTGTIETGISDGLAAAEDRLTGRINGLDRSLSDVQSTLDARIEGALSNLTPAIEARLAERLDGDLGTIREDLSTIVTDSVREGVAEQMPALRIAASKAVAEGLSSVDQRIDTAVAQSANELRASVATQVERQVTKLNISGQIATATATLEESVRGELATTTAELQGTNNRALNNAMVALRGEFNNGGRVVAPRPFLPRR